LLLLVALLLAQQNQLKMNSHGINSALGLKEAKDLVDATPATLIEKGSKEAVDKAKAALEAAGAKVSIK
jgi:large subunit ribosomal protein L7/L12